MYAHSLPLSRRLPNFLPIVSDGRSGDDLIFDRCLPLFFPLVRGMHS